MDEQRPLSMTTYYGCMHAFVSVFTGEMTMVRDLVVRLEGQRPMRAFGWQAALDRALRRAAAILGRWGHLNEGFETRVRVDDIERRIYGQSPLSAEKSAQTARKLSETMRRLRDHVEGTQVYGAQDVRWISGVAEEMAQAIGAEVKTASLVAGYLERGAPDAQRARPPEAPEKGESLSAYFRAFSIARDDFRADLDG